MSNFINSEAIFGIIGDYPVTDQFDVLYSNLQAGSTHDNYITGSLLRYFTNISTGKRSLITGERGLVFNKLTVTKEKLPNHRLVSTGETSRSYDLQPWRERAGIIKNIKLFSNERFYDSMTPSLSEMYDAAGGDRGVIYRNASGSYSLSINISDYAPSLGGQMRMFPFEPRFSKVKRLNLPSEGFKTSLAKYSSLKLKLLPRYGDGGSTPVGHPWISNGDPYINMSEPTFDLDMGDIPPGLDDSDASKVLFGIGDQYDVYRAFGVGYNNMPRFRSGSFATGASIPPGAISLVCGPIIRGWRYGLIDGMPHYTSAIFIRNKFGQFRDMLEQRIDSAMIVDNHNAPLSKLDAIEKPAIPIVNHHDSMIKIERSRTPTPVVIINFVRQSYIESSRELLYFSEKPENTWSSNLSLYATSSLPYFDDISRNRNQITTTPGSIILSSLADVFGNVTIGS